MLEPYWSIPPVFGWLARTGGVAPDEMLRVFNCGIGMVVVVSDPDAATELLRDRGESVARIGHIAAAAGSARGADRPARRLAWVKRRTAILISGRGSNMAALIAAARDPAYPAEDRAGGVEPAGRRRAGTGTRCRRGRDGDRSSAIQGRPGRA